MFILFRLIFNQFSSKIYNQTFFKTFNATFRLSKSYAGHIDIKTEYITAGYSKGLRKEEHFSVRLSYYYVACIPISGKIPGEYGIPVDPFRYIKFKSVRKVRTLRSGRRIKLRLHRRNMWMFRGKAVGKLNFASFQLS